MTDMIERMMKFDPLAAAEKITGIEYKDTSNGEGFDNPSVALGLVLMQEHSKAKRQMLTERGDTTLTNTLERYLQIIGSIGFEEIFQIDFTNRWESLEHFFIYARRDGLLLKFDTFNSKDVNSGSLYYNWRPHNFEESWGKHTSSGSYRDGIWVGDHDAREALCYNIDTLAKHGVFVAPWEKCAFPWLLHYGDHERPKDEPFKDFQDRAARLTLERMNKFPVWAQEMIGAYER